MLEIFTIKASNHLSQKKFRKAELVQRYSGHSDVAMTLRYYVDVFPEEMEEATEAMSQK